MATQKELKNRYMDIIRTDVWADSERMQKYAEKQFYVGVELDNGDLYVIDKPSIQKNFCFGYGMYGRSDDEDYDRAAKMMHHAETDEQYFIDENMSEFNQRIQKLEEALDEKREAYKYLSYCGQPEGSKLKTYTACRICSNPEYEPWQWSNCRDLEKLTEKEIQALIGGYKAAKEMFMKRLQTYLKRYGLSKLHTWTYLRD